jgi:hypothetical protein
MCEEINLGDRLNKDEIDLKWIQKLKRNQVKVILMH